LLRIFAEMTSI